MPIVSIKRVPYAADWLQRRFVHDETRAERCRHQAEPLRHRLDPECQAVRLLPVDCAVTHPPRESLASSSRRHSRCDERTFRKTQEPHIPTCVCEECERTGSGGYSDEHEPCSVITP